MPKKTEWFPKELKETYKKEISTFELARSQVEESEIDKLAETVITHQKEQMKKKKEKREVYFDGKRHFILLTTPEKPAKKPKTKTNPFTNKEEMSFFSKFFKGMIYTSFTVEDLAQVGWNNNAWVAGKFIDQIDIMGYPRKYHDTIEEAIEANTTEEKPILLENLIESDIIHSYIFNVWQVIWSDEESGK